MKWFKNRLNQDQENNVSRSNAEDDVEFKSFSETYRIITFALSTGMIYPNPATEKTRLLAIPIYLTTTLPLIYTITYDVYHLWFRQDIVNIIRHSTVLGPFLGGFFKMFLMFHKRHQAKAIIDEMNRDYQIYNSYTGVYRQMARDGVRNSQIYSERCWFINVFICVTIFCLMAVVLNTYSSLFESEPVKYMMHEVPRPGYPDGAQHESPFFELMFGYMMLCSAFYIINFTGYDGFYGLASNHACMKMSFFCRALEDAMLSDDPERGVIEVINEQNRMYEFVGNIQDTFNIWLGIIFVATMIQICCCLYHITEGYGFDLRYMIFVIGAVIHIYLPCRYAAKMKAKSTETSSLIYCCGWEGVDNARVRRMIPFMVARAQNVIEITGFGMLAFDMELFVSIMQTSYSMYTLLRS